MIDARARAALRPTFDLAARPLARAHVKPVAVTLLGLAVGLGACAAVALEHWWVGLGLFVLNRYLDGVDGALARRGDASAAGGFIDFAADLVFYAAFVLAVAVAVPEARLACAALLAAFYVNAGVWLTLSSLLEQRRADRADERSLRFVPGLVEGAETILVFVAFCVFHEHAEVIAWTFAGLVGVSIAHRLLLARRLLDGA
ncbi:MAG: CDP-alcohol phosphatidyltransferase family protein [Gaiellaceae bacterium]